MSDKILRHGHPSDTAANWKANNPVIGKGEFAIESDTGKFKIGDGTTKYNSLDYLSSVTESDVTTIVHNGLTIRYKYLNNNDYTQNGINVDHILNSLNFNKNAMEQTAIVLCGKDNVSGSSTTWGNLTLNKGLNLLNYHRKNVKKLRKNAKKSLKNLSFFSV